MEQIDYEKIKKDAEQLLDKYGIIDPVVDIFGIAQNEGIALRFVKMPERLKDVAGFYDDQSQAIFVNDDDPTNRQTFTIAHELGHKILGHNPNEYGVLFRRQIFGENPPAEKEANWFAANLLVPEKMLRRMKKKYDLTERDTEVLAGIFGVSREMMQYRIKQLQYAQ